MTSPVGHPNGVFDFETLPSFAREYLATYYCQPPTVDEQVVMEFLARHYRRIHSSPCAIEVGCGPTVHHVLPLAPLVSEIHMADYLRPNLVEVRRWRDGVPDAHDWRGYTELTLALEGLPAGPADVEQRERETREKISALLHCDLKQELPLGAPRQYDVVCSFYCAENIGITVEEWFRVMRRLAGLTAPGGHLFLSALRDTDFYVVRNGDGDAQRLPAARLTPAHFERALPELGFRREGLVVESADLAGQEDEGVSGVILVAAVKA